jgi:hypothetical protein
MRKPMKKRTAWALIGLTLTFLVCTAEDCSRSDKTSTDRIQQAQQEQLQAEASRRTGMPAINDFRERNLMKLIYELRDKGVLTHAYLLNHFTGKFIYLGQALGYPLPYSAQYSNPQKIAASGHQYGYAILPQAEPNGLFTPQAADGTWVILRNPSNNEFEPQYIEEKVQCFTFKLPASKVQPD